MNKFAKRWCLALAVACFGATAMAADEGPIKLGAILSVTGPGSFLGDPEAKTMRLFVDRVNAEGGVLGRKLEAVIYDDGTDSAKANSFAKRLISSDKVHVFTASTTGSTMAAVPLAEKAKVPMISAAGGIVITDPVKKWIFKTPQTDRQAAERIFDDMKKRGFTKIALLSEASGFGQSGKKESEHVVGDFGLEIVENEVYGAKDTDVTPQLTKIRGNKDVQAVLVFGFGRGPALVTRNYRQLGIDLPLYQSHGVASDQFIELAGDAANGVRLPSPALIVADQLPDDDPQKPVLQEYIEAYTSEFNEPISTFGGYVYDMMRISVDAIERAGSTDSEKLRQAIEETHDFPGVTGVFNMSETDHTGLDAASFKMVEIQDGKWKLLN